MTWKRSGAIALAGSSVLLASLAHAQVPAIIDAEQARIEQAQKDQQQIDAIVKTTRARFDEWQGLLKEIENYRAYNDGLQARVDEQNRVLRELAESIDQVTVIERQIVPLMTRMIDGLEKFIELDAPFLLEERRARVARLRNLLTRNDVTTATQFRNVLEAWQIENDYGRFPETYTDVIHVDGKDREVSILKIGRVALIYLTPDRRSAGFWDKRTREWVPLDDSFLPGIETGLGVISSSAPEMFVIPIAPAED
jgi:Protein of unknown function (DUF3450)